MTQKTIRILGIDPGFGRTGWGVIEKTRTGWKPIAYGCIETSAKKTFVARIEELHEELTTIVKTYKPQVSAVEELFFYKNVTTAIQVGQARGVILLTLRQGKLPVLEFTPLQVKQGITGYGRADKKQIETMVRMILHIKEAIKPDDAADALAVALTCGSALPFLLKKNKKKVS